MKKLFFLTAILAIVALSVNAQVKIKGVDATAFRKKAQAALKTQGTQQGMKAVKPGEECSVFVEAKVDQSGASYKAAKEFLIISNDGVTGFGFTFYTTVYENKTYLVMRGIPLEAGVCVDATSKITITFEDGTQFTLKNFAKDNCKGLVETYFGELLKNMDVVEAIKTKKVKAIKLEGVEKTVVKSLSEGNQQQIQGTFQCLN